MTLFIKTGGLTRLTREYVAPEELAIIHENYPTVRESLDRLALTGWTDGITWLFQNYSGPEIYVDFTKCWDILAETGHIAAFNATNILNDHIRGTYNSESVPLAALRGGNVRMIRLLYSQRFWMSLNIDEEMKKMKLPRITRKCFKNLRSQN